MRGVTVFRIKLAFASGAVLVSAIAGCFAKTTDIPAAQNQSMPERLQFRRGVTEVARKGSLKGYAAREYVFSASEGQMLSVKLNTKNGHLVFSMSYYDSTEALNFTSPPIQVTQWEGRAPKTGEYVISVYLMRSGARRNLPATFTLKTNVTGNGLAQTADATRSSDQKSVTYHCDDKRKINTRRRIDLRRQAEYATRSMINLNNER